MSGNDDLERSQLIDKARSFLTSPEIKGAEESKKREFLHSKGLQDDEIDQLLSSGGSEASLLPSRFA
jgi:hypothetical protein